MGRPCVLLLPLLTCLSLRYTVPMTTLTSDWVLTKQYLPPAGVMVLCWLPPLGHYTAWRRDEVFWCTSIVSRPDMWETGYLSAPCPERWMRIPG